MTIQRQKPEGQGVEERYSLSDRGVVVVVWLCVMWRIDGSGDMEVQHFRRDRFSALKKARFRYFMTVLTKTSMY